MSTEPGW